MFDIDYIKCRYKVSEIPSNPINTAIESGKSDGKSGILDHLARHKHTDAKDGLWREVLTGELHQRYFYDIIPHSYLFKSLKSIYRDTALSNYRLEIAVKLLQNCIIDSDLDTNALRAAVSVFVQKRSNNLGISVLS